MWLRPRTEMLPLDIRWWEYADDPRDVRHRHAVGRAERCCSYLRL